MAGKHRTQNTVEGPPYKRRDGAVMECCVSSRDGQGVGPG